ncbi:clasp N terminal-domain-containing protein [Phanerochaete sordida]|uniref:Clasp N terminal-domain-containing protein n=1 Tax=Phanerochaete sordida TaxID=48140 RepID=A0A9P3L738_9APHY|nr:clasp N terminal-domain-containing protein [Phanerochaete sordida]
MSDSSLDRLINLCRSNDNDVRVDAVTKLQAEFEAGIEITDPDGLLTVLKACLRTPNQHLTTATISAIPPLIPLLVGRPGLAASQSTSPHASTSSVGSTLIDVPMLRQVLNAFLPAGGILDRLGDSRDRARERARESLVLLGGYAFRCAGPGSSVRSTRDGKGPETPMMIFERHVKELALTSKVWRVREQAIVTLAQIRRAHHQFPLRPYLPALVDLLEDADSNVRTTAQASVVELFTGPGVTDGARADLKKEMAKKGVRKGTVESITARLLAAGGAATPPATSEAGSENGDAGGAYIPPSMSLTNKTPGPGRSMSRSVSAQNVDKLARPASRSALVSPLPDAAVGGVVDVKAVYVASSRDLENEFTAMLKHFEGREDEHNWAPRERAILRVRGMLKGDVHERYPETFLQGLKNGFIDASLKTLHSLRTTVAANTCSLYAELATALGMAIDPLCETMYINLLKMASLTKKIVAQQSQATVTTIINNASPLPRMVLSLLSNAVADKSVQTRTYAFGHLKTYLEVNGQRAHHTIESVGGVETLEKCIKKGLTDPNPAVKETTRQAFWEFERVWRDRGRAILESLDTMSRKQLERACPDPQLLSEVAVAVATPQVKKTSVAAAIAASRAKAKAIATAPPSLRHQATSAARTTSPPAKRPASPSLSSSSSGPSGLLRAASPIGRGAQAPSPSPPRARVVSTGTLGRSTTSGFVPNRGQAREPVVPPSPPSPTPDPTYRRRVSSPLASSPNGSSTLRRAMQTALPSSPPPRPAFLQNAQAQRAQSHHAYRESISIAGMHGSAEDSLLLASNIPIPEDSDSDMEIDTTVNLISFSSPFEVYPPGDATPQQPKSAASFSPRSSGSRPPLSNALSTGTSSPPAGIPQPIVEDAMRARAEQAESAAERLLELVDPEDEHPQSSVAPLLLRSSTSETLSQSTLHGSAGAAPQGLGAGALQRPRTPPNKNAALMRKAALFQDSPAYKARATTSPFDMINGQTYDNAWWRKRMSLVNDDPGCRSEERADRQDELRGYVAALEQGPADVPVLQKLALFCRENPANEPISPISPDFSGGPLSPSPLFGSSHAFSGLKADLWVQGKAFERLFAALVLYLDPTRSTAELEYGLIVLWEILEHQAPLLEGRETDIFALLLKVRSCGNATVLQATTNFRDVLASRIEPVYGLTTMHASLRAYRDLSAPPAADVEISNGTYAFGLIALGKFILRLPKEVLEDELPRLRITLTSALTDTSSDSALVVREAAAASIIAAQLVLRDEAHLFALLDPLPEDKKNLLTYLFDKHGVRGASRAGTGLGTSGMDKLEREMRRLDGRTSTPLRPTTATPFV